MKELEKLARQNSEYYEAYGTATLAYIDGFRKAHEMADALAYPNAYQATALLSISIRELGEREIDERRKVEE